MSNRSFDPQAFSREIPAVDGPAPVHLWDPPFCGDIDMRIARDGTWYYQGSPIRRDAMVRLFSSVLRRDGDDHFLVTPVEKLGITVEDCPFVAIAVEEDTGVEPSVLRFTLNNGEQVPLDEEHVLRVEEGGDDQPHPVLPVRAGLEALVSRPVFYELVERAEEQPGESGRSGLVLTSAGRTFLLGRL
ncbi:MAG: DUF1285 domain-containing protein [Pseudohongiellaceae bacterium]